MTTPGSQRTKLWRSINKKRYSDYQREYMRKYREKKAKNGMDQVQGQEAGKQAENSGE